jgi:hypothetical protein
MLLCRTRHQRGIALPTNKSVFGIYTDQRQVDDAVHTLRTDGFRTTDVSVLFPDKLGTTDPAFQTGREAAESSGSGSTIGGALGLLAGIGALAVPGFGSFIVAGPIIGALAGAAAVGTVGGVAGGLIGLGLPEYEAKHYESRIRTGGILIAVHCDDPEWAQLAMSIMVSTGARDVASTVEEPARPKRRVSGMA